jgi:eukaryotic-like serine/threonine-protein kinase
VGVAAPSSLIRERYRLDALIGEGGMAEVWRAWDLTLQRPVAVKLLFARDARDEAVLVSRFLREARIAASVQHRNVIHIVDFGTTPENQPFMVMELLEGETLAARLRREKRLSVADTVQIANLTLRGLSAVHAAGIIHRDLKPDNVYLKTEGDFVYPKILDFGISRSIDPASGQRTALTTRDGVIVGTPEYMSPEQARGVKRLDYRTDIYSMGVVLYEALSGRLPYTSENVGDLIIRIVRGGAPKLHEIAPTVPVTISEVVARAMAREVSDRFSDAAAMQETLLDAAAHALGEGTARALSDLPPQRPSPAAPIPVHLRTTRRPPSPMPRTPPLAETPVTPVTLDAEAPASGDEAAQGSSLAALELNVSGQPPANANAAPAEIAAEARADGQAQPLARAELLSAALARTLSRSRRAWPLMAAGALMTVGSWLLFQLPSAPEKPRARPAQLAAPAPASVAQPPATIQLQLRGLPADAFVTLDGEPSSATLTLPKSSLPHSVAVSAPGKTAWRINYVPSADEVLDVNLRDEPAPPPTAATPKRIVPRKRHKTKAPGALRVPDF